MKKGSAVRNRVTVVISVEMEFISKGSPTSHWKNFVFKTVKWITIVQL